MLFNQFICSVSQVNQSTDIHVKTWVGAVCINSLRRWPYDN